jgi:polysaccharide lyase-like protein
VAAMLLMSSGVAACRPDLDIGGWTCSADGSASPAHEETAAVDMPWKTGFENRFCDYTELGGFCYQLDSASYELVTTPHHSGQYAAAFRVRTDGPGESQARCIRQGILPAAAYYGAWYYIPEVATEGANWNLFHFRGGSDLPATVGVLDVSLVNVNDALQLRVFGKGHHTPDEAVDSPPLPIGEWFHVQLYVKRGSGTDGQISLYLNGQQVFDAPKQDTDDSSLGQWYLGNLATDLTPSDVTLYVDDVSISARL